MPLDSTGYDLPAHDLPDPCSVEGLIAWLETQPSETVYDWTDLRGNCLIGRYGNAVGVPWQVVHTKAFYENWLKVAFATTYGEALANARHLIGM